MDETNKPEIVENASLTEAQRLLVDLDLNKKKVDEYYSLLEETLAIVAKEIGINGYFRADDGTVYKITVPDGTFVSYKPLAFVRTKREGESRGTLSVKEADIAIQAGLVSNLKKPEGGG